MPTFHVEFLSPTGWADQEIDAANPDEALKAAQKLVAEDPDTLWWDETRSPKVIQIIVMNEGAFCAVWDMPKSECPFCK